MTQRFHSGYISKENENTKSKRYMHPCVYSSIIYNTQNIEAIQVPINRQMEKEDVVYIYIYTHIHTHNGILLSLTKE